MTAPSNAKKISEQIGDAKFQLKGPGVYFPEKAFWYQIDRVEGSNIILKIVDAPR